MSVANKTRALLNLTGYKPSDLAGCLEKSVQSVRNKFSQDVFTVSDLLRIAEFTNSRLLFRTQDGQEIFLSLEDIKDVGSKEGGAK